MPSAVSDSRGLRAAMALIEQSGSGDHRPVHPGRSGRVTLGETPTTLDAILGGGLPRGALHEVVAASPRDEAAAAAFAMALAMNCADGAPLIWIIEDRAAWETGTPYRPGLAAHGFDPDQLVLVRTKDTLTTLWATEEALRAGAPAVLTELWHAERYDLAASRRLLVAARRTGAACLLVHVGLHRTEGFASAADTRFAVTAHVGEHRVSAGGMPIPGPAAFAVRLLKLRGSAADGLRGFDRDQVHALVWDRSLRRFRPAMNEDWRRTRGPLPRGPATDAGWSATA